MSRCSTDLVWALLIGMALLIPLLLWETAHPLHLDSYSMRTWPPDDEALTGWIRSQAGIDRVEVRRSGATVEIRFRGPQQVPPWRTLGYEPGEHIRLELSFFNFADPKLLVAAILSSQAGFLVIGLRRLRRARKAGEPLPSLVEGKAMPALAWGILAGGLLVGFSFLYEAVLGRLGGPSARTPSIWGITRDFPVWGKAMILLGGAVAGPLAEEIFFRGAQFGAFVGGGWPILGAAVTSIFFASCHLDPVNFVAFVVFGLGLAWLYRKTRSILAPVVAHLLSNAVAFFLLFRGG